MQGQPVSIAIIGDTGVGKSSLCYRFFNKRSPPEQYRPTLAVDYFVKPILNHPNVSRFAVFDISVTPQIYSRSPCLGVVYDVAKESSFLKAIDLISFLDTYHSVLEKCVIIIANNCNSERRRVTLQEGISLSTKWKAKYIETDAMSGYNVEAVFWTFASDFCARMCEAKKKRRRASQRFTLSQTLLPPQPLNGDEGEGGLIAAEQQEGTVDIKTEDEFRKATLLQEETDASESSSLLNKKKSRCGCTCSIM